jgi:CheY-like chemotaxis protein
MGGDVTLSSKLAQGTTAKLVLPYTRDAAATADQPAADKGAAQTSQRLSIMLVDDVEMNRELFNIILANLGHRTLTFDNAPAAIDVLKSGADVDLILMDVQMPNMDGLEAARRIRGIEGRAGRTPIIALSANVMPEQVDGCLAAGMNAHLGKPFTEKGLQTVILNVMQGSHDPRTGDDAELSAAVGRLRQRYRSTLSAVLTQLDCQGPISTTGHDISGIQSVAHQIVGTAGALGMAELSEAASKLARLSATDGTYQDGGRALGVEIENLRSALKTEMSRQDEMQAVA